MDCRQAGVNRLGDAEHGAMISIFGTHNRPEAAHYWKVIKVAVGDHAASETSPQMEVRVDKTGERDAIAAVDLLCAGRAQLGPDGDKHAVARVHVAARYIA